MINEYLQQLQEGYLFSDKDLSVNLDKFENKQSNKLLIFGPCGSGKSTTGRKLSKKYNVPLLEIDHMYWGMRNNAAENNLPRRERKKQILDVRSKLIKMLTDNKKLIIEGVDWIDIYREYPEHRKLLLNQSMIILGLSSWRAGIRAGKRNMSHGENWKELYKMTKINYQHLEKWLGMIRNDVKNIAVEYKDD